MNNNVLIFIAFFTAWFTSSGSLGATAAESISLVDDSGQRVVLPAPAKRIVALSPHIVENLFAVGAGDMIVAAVAHSDYPPAASALPRIGGFDTYNLEAIVALSPDLVIAWGSGNGDSVINQLRDFGIPVYVDEPQSLHDVARSLRKFSQLADTQAQGNEVARQFEADISNLRRAYGAERQLRVFYQIWSEPLQTVNGDHLISDVVALCGGSNVFADAQSPAPKISLEAVIARDPDVIVASGIDENPPEWLYAWRRWSGMTAVRHDTLFHVPPDLLQRHTPRLIDGARMVCDALAEARPRLRSR